MSAAENKAVFLSYASQDAEAVSRIAEALRATGVEVWFDKNELVGGDAWDKKIRQQIKECALFVPVISANTQARPEGYFRLEWLLAVERSRLMSDDHPFLFPVVIDETSDAAARVPDRFRDVQWTRLNVKDTPESLANRVAKVLGQRKEPGRPRPGERDEGVASPNKSSPAWLRHAWAIVGLLIGLFYAITPLWKSIGSRETKPPAAAAVVPAAPTSLASPSSEAEQLVKQARELIYDPDSAHAEFALAENLLKRATDLAPTSGAAWGASALLQHYFYSRAYDLNKQRLVRSQSEGEKAMRLDPRNTDALLALGLHRQALDENDRAKDYLERARAADPQNFKAILAQSLLISDLLARAKFLLDAAPSMSRPAEIYYYASINLAWARQFVAAQVANDRGIAAQPFWRLYVNAAFNEEMLTADPAKMTAWLDKVPELKRDEPRVAFMYVQAAMLRRDGARAVRVLQASAADDWEDNYFIGPKAFLLAQAHELAGQRTAAAEQWQVAERTTREKLAAGANVSWWRAMLAVILAAERRGPEAKALAEVCAADERVWVDDYTVEITAQAFTMLNEPSRAIAFLRAHRSPKLTGFVSATTFAADPRWDSLRSLPEYPLLLEELKRAENSATASTTTTVTAPKPDEKSVALLAFANLSDDKDNEYFSDGISEELLNVLAKTPGLKVSARTSAFSFKGKNAAIPDIAKQLGVAYVVEGSVQRAGQKVRITAQLIKAADGFHVWSEHFDRELSDIFALQDEIAGLIAQNLQLKLDVAPQAAKPVNPEAFSLFLQARQYVITLSVSNLARAEQLYLAALKIDPDFARASAGLALLRATRVNNRDVATHYLESELAPLERDVRGLLRREPNLAEAYAALAIIHVTRNEPAKAEGEFFQADKLGFSRESSSHLIAFMHFQRGRVDLAIAAMEAARVVNPLAWTPIDVGALGLLFSRRYPEAVDAFRTASRLGGAPVTFANLALSLNCLGRTAEAKAAARQALNAGDRSDWEPGFLAWSDGVAAWALADAGEKAEAEMIVQRLLSGPVESRFCAGFALAELGRLDEAATVLADYGSIYTYLFYYLNEHPALLNDPRFARLPAALKSQDGFETFRRLVATLAAKP